MGAAICVYRGSMTEGAMNSLNIVEVTRMFLEVVEEFKSLDREEANLPGWNVS